MTEAPVTEAEGRHSALGTRALEGPEGPRGVHSISPQWERKRPLDH